MAFCQFSQCLFQMSMEGLIEYFRFFDKGAVRRIGDDQFLVGPAVFFVLFQHGSHLGNHRLWWVDIGPWPSWNEFHLTERSKIKH